MDVVTVVVLEVFRILISLLIFIYSDDPRMATMDGKEGDWWESDLYCTCCGQVVTQKTWENGFMMLRCQCIKKAGHHEVHPARWWIDKCCRGDERTMRLELMNAGMDAYID